MEEPPVVLAVDDVELVEVVVVVVVVPPLLACMMASPHAWKPSPVYTPKFVVALDKVAERTAY